MVTYELPDDCVLVRTQAGSRKMRDRGEGLTPKLRSVLFLVDGSRPLHAILDRAGGLRRLLASQLQELHALGLVECRDGKVPSHRPAHPSPRGGQPAETATAIVGAKIRLLDALESVAGDAAAHRLAGPLIEARTWSDLAHRTRNLAGALQNVAGTEQAAAFWTRAKEILLAARGTANGEAA